MSTPQRRSWRSAIEVAVLALVAYVPLLLNARGAVAADTKLYLTLDPSRLLGDAAWTWDTRQFGGWVPHQVVGYLWPAGPWYWFAETIHLADWVAQRLWIGTLLFAAGTGVRWAAQRLGFGARGTAYVPITAAFVYMLSPYVLPYISRTSVLLAPWAGLGWLIGLTVLAARNGGWRHPALFALIIATIGGSNGTALVMIAPAPILYLLDAGIRREVPWRRALGAGARIGALAALVSVWWAAGVYIQGRYGADVLAYSETVQSTSFTSSAPEVLRGLGYWLFYVRDAATATTSASGDYQTSTALITWGWMLLVAGFAGIALLRWRARSFAALCVLAGVVLAVGVHPLDDASPLMRVFADHPRSSLVLALRSSSRAVPVSLFGLALGAAVGAGWIAARWRRWGVVAPVALVLLAGLNVPAMRSRQYVDAALLHDEAVPAAWRMAATDLDAAAGDGSVLLLPGVESAAYRWGYTVDPVLPGISDRDLLTRDWLPLGSAPLMDLLYALDDRFQEGTVEATAIAPVARLLGADTIMIANDTAFEHFRTVRPEQAWGVYTAGVPGLGPIIGYGQAVPNVPAVPVVDEAALLVPGVGEPMPPVALAPVESAPGRARAASGPLLLVAGSGDGLVDAAAAGLIDGVEVVAYTGALDDDLLDEQLGAGAGLIVTDSNRDRAHHWRNAQDVTGFTEAEGTELLTDDPFDQRLPVLPDAGDGDRTVAEQRGPVTAQATSYGEPNGYRPEDRPFMAIDGDPTTAWVTADRARAVGEAIEVRADEPVAQITLTQPDAAEARRWITGVRVITDDGTATEVELGPESRTTGQVIDLPGPTTSVRVEITATNLADSGFYPGENAVGFAEVDLGLGPSTEVFVMPSRALQAAAPGTPLDIVMTRARVDPTHRWRSDPEPALSREFELAQSIDAGVTVTARLSPRAGDDVLAALAGANPAVADRRISGPPVATGWQAFDGDPDTAWITPFETPTPSTLTVPLGPATTIDHLRVTTRTGTGYAQPTTFEISAGGETRTVDTPPSTTGTYDLAFPALTGDALSITIVATDGTTTIDRRLWEPVSLPVAVSEVTIDGVAPVAPPAALDTGCRSDLLAVDGVAVPVQVTGAWPALAAGAPAQVALCGPASTLLLSPGAHLVTSTPGASTGIDIDRVVFGAGPPPPAQTPIRVVNERGHVRRTVYVAACPTGCWLLQGEGWNPGWKATLNGHSLGRPTPLGGGMNAWWLEPSNVVRTVKLHWTPQWLLWVGLAVSAAAVLVCIGLAVAPVRRRRRPRDAPLPAEDEVVDPAVDAGPRVPPRTADWVAAAVTLAAGMLVVGVVWGLICGVVMAVAAFLGRRWIGPAAALALVAFTGVYIVAHENEGRFGAGFGWVGEFGEAHQPALAAVVLLVGSVAAAEWGRQREARRQEAEAVI